MPKDTFFNLNKDKQEKVVRAAVSEFLKQGFEKGNIGSIAKNAGVAKGSMYQYFENKKELFMYSVQWAVSLFVVTYSKFGMPEDMDIFDYYYHSTMPVLQMIREERELTVFIQNVFLGKYSSMTDESLNIMMKESDEFILKLIQKGKKNGSIRNDIDDHILSLFMTGASMKIKENILRDATNSGTDIIDEGFEKYRIEINAMLDLLKNGMGVKPCL